MSEPDGAFLRLHLDRDSLVRWLDAAPPSPERWADWSEIGGQWYLGDGPRELRDTPVELAAVVAGVGATLKETTNRTMLLDMFRPDDPYGGESAATRHIAYDAETGEFTAGALLYAEGLENLIGFLTVARGGADALGPSGRGVAVVHNWMFDGTTQAALRLGPGGSSRFLSRDEEAEAVELFQPIAERFLTDQDHAPEPIDHLDALRAGPDAG